MPIRNEYNHNVVNMKNLEPANYRYISLQSVFKLIDTAFCWFAGVLVSPVKADSSAVTAALWPSITGV